MWVLFTRDYDWTPAADRRRTIAFTKDWTGRVTRECARAAQKAGAAAPVPRPATKLEADLLSSGGF